jgi:hypothetical protein
MSLALMRCARRIALYSECWNGEGWKLNECESQVRESDGFGPFFGFGFFSFFPFSSGLRVSLVQVSSGNRAFTVKLLSCFPDQPKASSGREVRSELRSMHGSERNDCIGAPVSHIAATTAQIPNL